MRVVPAPLLAVLQGHPLAGECLILVAPDGTRAGFTSLDVAQTVDLGLGAGAETCGGGMVLSALTLAAGLEASFAELHGPLGPILTRAAVDNGKWDDAQAWLVRVSPGQSGFAPLLYGKAREVRSEGNRFVTEIRGSADALGQELGRKITAYCRHRFGSVACGATPVEVAGAVAAGAGTLTVPVTFSGTLADDAFNQGELEFTSGELAGVIAEQLFDFAGGTGAGTVTLRVPLRSLPAESDTVTLRAGCAKTRAACMVNQPDGDAAPFGGFPDVPGGDQAMRYPNPGGGS